MTTTKMATKKIRLVGEGGRREKGLSGRVGFIASKVRDVVECGRVKHKKGGVGENVQNVDLFKIWLRVR